MVDYKSPDPMYDLDKLESHTPPAIMETPEVFKRKEPDPNRPTAHPSPTARVGTRVLNKTERN